MLVAREISKPLSKEDADHLTYDETIHRETMHLMEQVLVQLYAKPELLVPNHKEATFAITMKREHGENQMMLDNYLRAEPKEIIALLAVYFEQQKNRLQQSD